MNLYNAIEKRISIRKYENKGFDDETVSMIKEKLNNTNPMNNDIKIRLELTEGNSIGMGFVEEQLVLEFTDIGIGSCWLGTYNDRKIRELLNLKPSENITNVIAVGYPSEQKSFRNNGFRKLVGSQRKEVNEIAFYNHWGKAVSEYLKENPFIEKALHMSKLAPSGGNKQPVYVVFTETSASFFVKNKRDELIVNPWAEIDAGIFISHFYLCLKNENIKIVFYKEKLPMEEYSVPPEFSYIISVNIE